MVVGGSVAPSVPATVVESVVAPVVVSAAVVVSGAVVVSAGVVVSAAVVVSTTVVVWGAAVVSATVVSVAGFVVVVSPAGGGGQGSAFKGISGGWQPATCKVAVTFGCLTVAVTMTLVKVSITCLKGSTTGMLNAMPENDEITVKSNVTVCPQLYLAQEGAR